MKNGQCAVTAGEKQRSDQFRIDYDDGSWQRADDWVHEYINEHWG
jgi:hypothetical protein